MKKYNKFINENKEDCDPNILGGDVIDHDNLSKCLKSPSFDIERKYGSINSEEGYTLLFYAVNWEMVDLVKILLENGADVNTVFNKKNLMINLVTKISFGTDTMKIMDILIEHDIDLNFKYGDADVFYYLKNGNAAMKLYAYEIPQKFPEQYKQYKINKDLDKFDI